MQTFRAFSTAQEARNYRHLHGTGGWIFVPDTAGQSIIFPPEMTPAAIMRHALVKGQSGTLIGSM